MSGRDLLGLPLAALAVFTGAKSFRDNPVLGNRWLNQHGLHVLRLKLAAGLAARRRRRISRRIPASLLHQFEQNGFICIENFLPQAEFRSLQKEVLNQPWDRYDMTQGTTTTRRVFLDGVELKRLSPALHNLISRRDLKDLIRYVAGTLAEPVFSLQAIFSGGTGKHPDPQASVHSDTFHSTAKAWLFLEDVQDEAGPLSYVPGSHRLTSQRLAWEKSQSLTAAESAIKYHARGSFRAAMKDLNAMNLPCPHRFAVPGNTLVIADTHGFHCRSATRIQTTRVEVYASLRRNPFVPFGGLDILSWPWCRERSGSLYLKAMEFGRRYGSIRMPWKQVGHGLLKQS
ncbi:MAG: phytanoyl-CoA dioxygenase family protein [Cyanobacteriota bacterium]|nr:phytanoyl-CoA dioxygenase family protein [Cyanobacteriota bacterium]